MVRGILFDFWGTIVENGVFPSPIKQVKYILRNKEPFHTYVVKFEDSFMLKEYEDLFAAFKNVISRFKSDLPAHKVEKLVAVWNKNKLLAKPFPETIETLKLLKKKYKLGLISNTDCFSVKEILDKFELASLFDTIQLSYEAGMLKSEPKFFNLALKDLKLKPEDVVMVGDSIESDMHGAEAAGIRGILVDRRDRREYKDKVASLSDIIQAIK